MNWYLKKREEPLFQKSSSQDEVKEPRLSMHYVDKSRLEIKVTPADRLLQVIKKWPVDKIADEKKDENIRLFSITIR